MARFRVEIFKTLGGEGWENRYHIETVSFTTAVDLANQIAVAEQAFHSEQVSFPYLRISTVVEGDNLFLTVPLNSQGLVPGSSTGGLLPLWNVVKAYFAKDLARPDFKLYRGVLGEANSENGLVAGTLVTNIESIMFPLVVNDVPVVFPISGPSYAGFSVDPYIRHRDLHRRRVRRAAGNLVTP